MNEFLMLLARSDGIASTLSPVSKAIVGGVFLILLGAVAWVVGYRRAAGTTDAGEDLPEDSP